MSGSREPLLLLIAIVAIPALWAVSVRRPALVLGTLVAVVPITAGLSRGFPLPGFKLSELCTVGLGIALIASADHRAESRWRLLDYAFAAFAAGHLVLSVTGSYVALEPLTTRGIGLAAGALQFFIFYRAVVVGVELTGRGATVLRLLIWASVPVSIAALGQGLGLTFLTTLLQDATGAGEPVSASVSRATGPYPHAQVLAPYLLTIIVLGAAILLHTTGGPRRALSACLALAGAALVMTLGIAAMLGVLAASGIVIMFSPHRRTAFATVGVAVALAGVAFSPLLTERLEKQTSTAPGTLVADRNPLVPQTVAYRLSVWETQMVPAVADRPISGYGPELPPRITWRFSESMYLTLLLRGGVPLFALWALLVAVVGVTTWRLRHARDTSVRLCAQALFALIVVVSVMQLIQPYFTYGGFAHVFWAIAGVMAAGVRNVDGTLGEVR